MVHDVLSADQEARLVNDAFLWYIVRIITQEILKDY